MPLSRTTLTRTLTLTLVTLGWETGRSLSRPPGSEPNNASTVLLVRVRGVSLLLTADVEPEAQRVLHARGGLGRVDVLKVAHHGSAYQDPDLLAGVRPRLAVVSVGEDNDYGHPARSTLAALRRSGAVVGRTDRDGTVLVAGSGRSVRLVTGGG